MSDDTIKLGRLARDSHATEIRVQRSGDDPIRLSFSLSSETPVDRWFGTEVLSHESGAIRMDRLAAGAAPLLFNHDWNDPIGMIDGARIEGGRLMVDAHLFATVRAREVAAMVDGGLRNVSVGYEILEMTEDTKRNTFTATSWLPLEGSIVTVPADPSVGIGRQADDTAKPVRVLRTARPQPAAPAAPSQEQTIMTVDTNTAAGTNADTTPAQPRQTPSALELEQARRSAIDNLAKANKIDALVRDHWVNSGIGLDEIAGDILRIVEDRGRNTPNVTQIGLSPSETKKFSLLRAVFAAQANNWTQAGFELECSREIAKRLNKMPDPNKFYVPAEVQERDVQRRDLTAGTGSAGGYLVATHSMSFIELMRNRSVVYRMGARRLSGLSGNVTIPKQTGAATAVWLANEASTATESAQTFGQISLAPKTVGAYTEISRQLMLQSSPDAEAIVNADLAAVCAIAIDVGALRGSGASGEPAGIVGTSGVGSVSGTSLAAAGILEFQSDVAGGNLLSESFGYVTTPAVAALLMVRPELPSTGTTRLWQGSMLDGSLFGNRAMPSNQMSSATMLGGDFGQVVVAEWGVLEVEVNPYANFQAGIVGVRALVTIDVGVRYGGSFSYASSIT